MEATNLPTPVPPVVPVQQPAVNPDTLITVKVSYNGGIRRFKLALRDLGPHVLPLKLRNALSIPEGQVVRFERYSDSAASFVVLNADNLTVYKQLYRAAKAKLKLRLKATVVTPEPSADASVSSVIAPPAYTSQVSLVAPAPAPAPIMSEQPASTSLAVAEPSVNEVVQKAVAEYLSSDDFSNQVKSHVDSGIKNYIEQFHVAEQLEKLVEAKEPEVPVLAKEEPKIETRAFLVYCNSCQKCIDGVHYHCSVCDKGDYDLCQNCVDKGSHCDGDHWLIKRTIENGRFVSSTTENLKRKQVGPKPAPVPAVQAFKTRTCNSCVACLPEECFVTCTVCEDYDVCLPCHLQQKHGHHPMHNFTPATKDTQLDAMGMALLAPGRGARHHAICDGCDATVVGVRHKCLSCPDWDYCSECVKTSNQTHPGHKFIPIYEATNIAPPVRKVMHPGVRCDGPLCTSAQRCIVGDRYKCAVCEDLDFCANCEASPVNYHNRTHPLIKMKTPIQGITCSTTENQGTPRETLLGDIRSFSPNNLKTTTNAATQVQTVADVEPEIISEKQQVTEPVAIPVKEVEQSLQAEYVQDTVEDGSSFSTGDQFQQVWTLTNAGNTAWPAGVTVRFVGGDHMFRDNSEHTCNATVTLETINPGENAHFSVDLVAPVLTTRRAISYWRLTAPNGNRFGHKLWCDIEIKEEKLLDLSETVKYEDKVDERELESSASSASSQMIFPKLDKESSLEDLLIVEQSIPSEAETTEAESEATLQAIHSPAQSPAWTVTLSEEEGHTTDGVTSEDDVESLMLDDEDYEVLETSDDDGFRRVI